MSILIHLLTVLRCAEYKNCGEVILMKSDTCHVRQSRTILSRIRDFYGVILVGVHLKSVHD